MSKIRNIFQLSFHGTKLYFILLQKHLYDVSQFFIHETRNSQNKPSENIFSLEYHTKSGLEGYCPSAWQRQKKLNCLFYLYVYKYDYFLLF